MPDETEGAFREQVVADLEDAYGAARVRTDVTLPATDRRCDIIVKTHVGADDLAIEVENDFEAVMKGRSQARLYAEQVGAEPYVVVPAGHVDIPEVFYLSGGDVEVVQWAT